MSVSSLLLEEKKAMLYVQEAKRKAQEIIQKAKAEAEKISGKSINEERIRKLLEEYHRKLQKEAEEILEKYKVKAKKIQSIPEELIEKAASLIVKEVLGHEL